MPLRTYAASTTAIQIASGDYLGQNGFIIYNNSTGDMNISFVNQTGELLNNIYSIPLPASGVYENYNYKGNIYARWRFAVGSGHITEF